MSDPDKAINEQYEEINQLKDDLHDERELRIKLADLLEQTANALKGQPGPLKLHDWSDLPEVATQLKAENETLKEELRGERERLLTEMYNNDTISQVQFDHAMEELALLKEDTEHE